MRRATFAILLVPSVLCAQFGRDPFRRGRIIPAEMPPQAPAIAREMQYRRLPISFETYTMMERFIVPGPTSGTRSSWSSFGAGSRAEYRFARNLSATADVTTAFLGAPVFTQTGELGLRLRPRSNAHRVYPFVDGRVAYVSSMNNSQSFLFDPSFQYSQGYGLLGGVGADVQLSRRFSLMSFAGTMRARAKSYHFDGKPPRGSFPMTITRFSIGLRYNPIRWIRDSQETPQGANENGG